MGSIAEKLREIHDGTTESDSRIRIGLALAAETATNLIIIATVQPAEIAFGSVVLLSAVTIFEGLHQAKNRDMRDDITDTERR